MTWNYRALHSSSFLVRIYVLDASQKYTISLRLLSRNHNVIYIFQLPTDWFTIICRSRLEMFVSRHVWMRLTYHDLCVSLASCIVESFRAREVCPPSGHHRDAETCATGSDTLWLYWEIMSARTRLMRKISCQRRNLVTPSKFKNIVLHEELRWNFSLGGSKT